MMRQSSQPQSSQPTPSQPVRLNKFLAQAIGVSRREADDLIERGRVEIVRGEIVHVAQLGDRVIDGDNVLVDGERVFAMEYTYLAINKPVGYVSSRRAQGSSPTLYELVPKHFRHLKTVGRLDKDSSGLLLLTNDGDFAYHMTHPQFAKHKVYKVTLDQDLAPLHQQMISDFGVELADGKSKLVLVKDKSRKKWVVEMSEGRNRQIRRTFGALGYTVEALHRVQFGPYQIGGLKDGEIQEVTKIE